MIMKQKYMNGRKLIYLITKLITLEGFKLVKTFDEKLHLKCHNKHLKNGG